MAQVASEGQFACANTMDLTPATTLVVPPAEKARHLERLLRAHDAGVVAGRPDMFGEMFVRECVARLEAREWRRQRAPLWHVHRAHDSRGQLAHPSAGSGACLDGGGHAASFAVLKRPFTLSRVRGGPMLPRVL
jgi:hypothetical protein